MIEDTAFSINVPPGWIAVGFPVWPKDFVTSGMRHQGAPITAKETKNMQDSRQPQTAGAGWIGRKSRRGDHTIDMKRSRDEHHPRAMKSGRRAHLSIVKSALLGSVVWLTILGTGALSAQTIDENACPEPPCIGQSEPGVICEWNPKPVSMPTIRCGRVARTGTPKLGNYHCGFVANVGRTKCIRHCVFIDCVKGIP